MIDWTQPVETTETPPRPVRVLCTDNEGRGYPIAVSIDGWTAVFNNEGETPQRGYPALRNVAPPRPEVKRRVVRSPIAHDSYLAGMRDGFEDADRQSARLDLMRHELIGTQDQRDEWKRKAEERSAIITSMESHRRSVEEDLVEMAKQRNTWKAKAEALQADIPAKWQAAQDELCSEIATLKKALEANDLFCGRQGRRTGTFWQSTRSSFGA